MSEEKDGIRKLFDKLILGAIIGGAIGSVLGLTLAPRKGKETREFLKDKKDKFVKEYGGDIEKITYATCEKSKSFFGRIGKRVAGIFEKRNKISASQEDKLWQIPDEFDM